MRSSPNHRESSPRSARVARILRALGLSDWWARLAGSAPPSALVPPVESSDDGDPDSTFHAGERAVQTRLGVRAQMAAAGPRYIRDHMPDQHRELFGKLPMLLVGSMDACRRPWASMLVARPGFISTPDERTLRVAAVPAAGDPLRAHLAPGVALGLLGIEPHTRRRNRANGRVTALDDGGFTMRVEQSFGNCAKYIQARTPHGVGEPSRLSRAGQGRREGPLLSDAARALVRRADTFFIASSTPLARPGQRADGADVSHRGGKPGFVHLGVEGGRSVLTVPDFTGNFIFNTLGNLAAHPYAGLLFADPDSGDVLQLTGSADVIWDGPSVEAFAGAQRLLRVTVDEGVWRPEALPLRWSAPELAPQLAQTGAWPD
jgi:predicted pyridoxine 5'-phosphate oxidase superfamily flavin-nucleotide-binding protein